MGLFVVYILKSALCLVLFYLFYMVLLSRDTFHRFNRVALLSMLLLSALLPVLRFETEAVDIAATPGGIEIGNMMATVLDDAPVDAPVSWIWLALIIAYIAGLLIFLSRNIVSVLRIVQLIRRGERHKVEGMPYILVLHNEKVVPFSWMRYVVMSNTDWEENGRVILTHEKAHLKLHHSYDMLLVELCVTLQWFNPAAWLLRRELQGIHEYEADEAVIREGVDVKQYQLLIIKKAVGARLYTIANSLNHSNIKKRITMMLKRKSNPLARFKMLYLLPAAALALSAFASPKLVAKANTLESKVNEVSAFWETSSVKIEESSLLAAAVQDTGVQDGDVVLEEELPLAWCERNYVEFPGGRDALVKFLRDNLTYPEEAKNAGIEGSVDVQFIVNTDGSLSNIAISKSSGNELLDKEALRLAALIPNCTPEKQNGEAVNATFIMPLVFSLNKEKEEDDDVIFQVCEVLPQFPGGNEALFTFLKNNVKYPQEAMNAAAQGRSIVRFVVNKDGSLSDFFIIKSAGSPYLDREALRVVKSMPKWTPGKQRGKIVKVKYALPVVFKLNNDNDNSKNAGTKPNNDDAIFSVCEEMPQFPGENEALFTFLKNNVKYPQEAIKAAVQGRSIVQFVVNEDGSLSDFGILRSAGNELLDNEALRVVKSMPKWTPGKQRGKAVRVKYTIPVVFNLQ